MRAAFGGRRAGFWWYMTSGSVLLLALAAVGLFRGSAPLEGRDVLAVLAGRLLPGGAGEPVDPGLDAIVWSLRAPRVAVAAMVGGCLALAGAQMQGLFRNPLASPGIVGTSTGAALGAVVALTFGWAGGFLLAAPLAAVAGALLSLLVVTRIAARDGYTPVTTLLLAGVALNALLAAVSSWLIARSWEQYEAARRIAYWMMGGVTDRGWLHAGMLLPGMAIGCALAVWSARDLDLLLEGEEVAASLGVEVERAKRVVLWSAAILTGSAVAVSGVVGFVGLVVPHLVRLLLGPAHRRLLPGAFLTGAWFVVGADLLARTVAAAPGGLPRRRHGVRRCAVLPVPALAPRGRSGGVPLTAPSAAAAAAPRLELRGAGVERRGRWLLRGVDLAIEPGRLTSVVGPNGAGKSTLLRLLSGAWRPSEGLVLLDGVDLAALPRRQAARRVAYVPQSARPTFEFTVREFVTLGRYPHESRLFGTRSADRGWIDHCLADTDVLALAERRVTTLSGGELQRVLMARCLAAEAETLLLDEPTSNLDLAHGLDLLGLARRLVDEGRSVALALHDLNAAARFADRVAVLDGGALVADGAPADVLEPDLLRRVFRVVAVPVSGAASQVFDFEPLA